MRAETNVLRKTSACPKNSVAARERLARSNSSGGGKSELSLEESMQRWMASSELQPPAQS